MTEDLISYRTTENVTSDRRREGSTSNRRSEDVVADKVMEDFTDVFKAYRGLKKDFQSCFDVMITFAGPNRYVTLPWMVSWYEDRSAFIITAMIGKGSTFVDSFVLDVKKWPAGWREDVAECRNTLHSFTMNAVGPMLRARLNSCNVVGDGYVFDPTHSGWNCLYHFDSHTNEDGVMGVLTFVLDTTKTEISD